MSAAKLFFVTRVTVKYSCVVVVAFGLNSPRRRVGSHAAHSEYDMMCSNGIVLKSQF